MCTCENSSFSRTIKLYRPVTMKKKQLTPYSILYKGNQVKISIQVISTKKNFLNDVIMTLTWPEYNLQTRYKMISQVLQIPQLSNFVRIVGVTRYS